MSRLHKKRITVGVLILVSFIVIMAIILNYIQYQKDHITDNVFDEFYLACTDRNYQIEVKNMIGPEREWRDFGQVWTNYSNYSIIFSSHMNSDSTITDIICVKKPRAVIFLNTTAQNVTETDGNGFLEKYWSACIYFLDNNELSYCWSDNNSFDTPLNLLDDLLKETITDWVTSNQGRSNFSIDNWGEFINLGYQEIQNPIISIVVQDYTDYRFDYMISH